MSLSHHAGIMRLIQSTGNATAATTETVPPTSAPSSPYDVPVSDTPYGVLIFTLVYVVCSFLFLVPVALWTRHQRVNAAQRVGSVVNVDATATGDQEMVPMDNNLNNIATTTTTARPTPQQQQDEKDQQQQYEDPVIARQQEGLHHRPFHRDDPLNKPLEQSPERRHRRSENDNNGAAAAPTALSSQVSSPPDLNLRQSESLVAGRPTRSSAAAEEQGSAINSTTSGGSALRRVVDTMGNKMGLQKGSVKAVVRTRSVRRFVHAERQSAALDASEGGGSSQASRSRDPSWLMMAQHQHHQQHGFHTNSRTGMMVTSRISDAAGSILSGEVVDGESDFYRQRYVERSRRRSLRSNRSNSQRRIRARSLTGSDFSIMPPLNPDALAPEDAADANDPGRPNPFLYQYNNNDGTPPPYDYHHHHTIPRQPSASGGGAGANAGGCFYFFLRSCGSFLDCVEPDGEMRRILRMAIPSVAGAFADRVLRLVLIGILSYYVDKESMVAFVLVTIFLRLTMEAISGAIVDTEVIRIQDALALSSTAGNGTGEAAFYEAGQTLQLALMVQTLIGVPVLIGWVFGIGSLVDWLMWQAPTIVELSANYTQVIVIDFYIRIAAKTLLAPFHMNGRAPFENVIDMVSAIATMVTIGVVVATEKEIGGAPTLVAVAWIQVIFSFAKTAVKLAYVNLKGWAQPYRMGFFGKLTLLDPRSVCNFIIAAFPMFIGALIELREWEILILFVRAVGPGQVVTWAIMGAVWEMFESSTDGLGGAGAMRISFYLAENQPAEARIISFKVVFLAVIQAFTFGSIFLMLGPNLSVWLTSEPILQNMFNDLVGLTALASFSMTFALIDWSLVGSGQGRFGIATLCTVLSRWLVVYPVAAICVLVFHHDTTTVAASVAIGYATAGYALGCVLIRSDWKQLAFEAHQDFFPPEDHDGGEDLDNEDQQGESSSSDDGSSIIL